MKVACTGCGAELEVVDPGAGRFSRHLEGLPILCERCQPAEKIDEEQASARAHFIRRQQASQLPSSLRDVGFAGFRDGHRPVVEAAQTWAGLADAGGLCLHGPVGVGKTHLAAAACWLRLQLHSCRWVSVSLLMAHLRMSFDDEEKAAASRVVAGDGAVILDDLDKVNPTEYGREVIFTAIDSRLEAGAPLLVTTNLPLSALGERYGEAIMSRLAGYCEVFEMAGSDRRLEAVK